MRIEWETKLDYKDVLIRPKRSTLGSRSEVELRKEYTFRNARPFASDPMLLVTTTDLHYSGIPIMAANMDGVGTLSMARSLTKLGLFTCLTKTYSADELVDFFKSDSTFLKSCAVSVGMRESDLVVLREVNERLDNKLRWVCVDVANGYSEKFVDWVSAVREEFPHLVIIAGNVVTGEMTEELLLAGADVIKVGIGPGSACTTRLKTGVGYPQLSAVIECADAAHGLGGHIIADGGCVCPGDVAKAFGAGADFVMLGGMFAGHDQSEMPIIERQGESFLQFYGMSSKAANDKHFGGLKEYRSSEGREVLVPYRGDVDITVRDILGGLRSACTYAGAKNLKALPKCTTFVRVTQQLNTVFANNHKS
jgi:GMP reductase